MKAIMKKVLPMLLVVTLVAGISIGGTLAYLTMDAGKESNVFSIGNIDVTLDEEVGIFGEGGEVKETEDGAEYVEVMPGDYLKKEVTVTNNGKTDAYVAVTVTMNNADLINEVIDEIYGEDNQGSQAMYDFIFDGWGINQNPRPGENGGASATGEKNARGVIDGTYGLPEHVLKVDFSKTTDFDNDTTMFGTDNWFQSEAEQNETKNGSYSAWLPGGGYYTGKLSDDAATAEDERDYVIVYTYYLYLPAGESSTLFEGLNVPAEFDADQLAMFDGLEINVEAKAIQADNMAIASQYAGDANGKAKTAFAILAGDIKTPEFSNKPTGKNAVGFTATNSIWGESTGNAKQSFEIKIYSGDTYMGYASLKNINNIIDGDVTVTWTLYLDNSKNGTADSYWDKNWVIAPSIDVQPTTVELWVDGVKVDEGAVQLNAPDNLNKIGGAVVDANGTILRYVVKGTEPNVTTGETYVQFVSSESELKTAITNGSATILLNEGNYTTNLTIDGGNNITINGKGANTVLSGQIASTSSTAGTLTIKNVTIKVDDSIDDSTGISQTEKSAIAIWGNQTVICENVTFEMSLSESSAISAWWDTGVGTSIIVRNCTFNCNGQRPIRATGNVTVEKCTFNDPYRYAVQLTAKTNTATEMDKAIINFNNNTIVNGENGKDYVYGVQLEGETYGCHDCVINGSGNTIVNGGTESTMYYCECGKVDHDTMEWHTEVTPVHAN